MIITRRQFLKLASASAASIGLSQTDILKLEKALASQPAAIQPSPSVIWLSGQACSGCPVSLLNRVVDTGGDLGSGYKYYDADMMNALYAAGLPTPGPFGNDRAGLPLNVVTDVADLLVGDAVRALVPGLARTMVWADDTPGALPGTLLDAYAGAFPTGYVTLDWNATVMAGAGDIPVGHLKSIVNGGGLLGVFVLMVDGAIPGGDATKEKYCYVFDNIDDLGNKVIPSLPLGASVTLADALRWMANSAACLAIIAVGACSSYGGIPHAKGNKTGAMSLSDFLAAESISKPLIKVPGCPPHPDWIIYPAAHILATTTLSPFHLGVPELDGKGRPKAVFSGTNPDQPFCYDCPNKPTQGTPQAAQVLGDKGCIGYLGCKGPYSFGDCPIRQKNTADDGTKMNWCVGAQGPGAPSGNVGKGIGEARHPCQGCIEPDFPDWASLTGNGSGIKGFYNP